jgi:hypothetical protein
MHIATGAIAAGGTAYTRVQTFAMCDCGAAWGSSARGWRRNPCECPAFSPLPQLPLPFVEESSVPPGYRREGPKFGINFQSHARL